MAEFKDLLGKVLTGVEKIDEDALIFTCDNGSKYKMYHCQDCCESVTIDDINGDLDDLIGTPILTADEKTNEGNSNGESETWTFYTIRTQKGSVDIKWYGESNGYYSESVDFAEADKDGNFGYW